MKGEIQEIFSRRRKQTGNKIKSINKILENRNLCMPKIHQLKIYKNSIKIACMMI